MNSAPISIGLIGCGDWGRHILRDLVALGCEVSVVARSEASRERARQGGAARIVATSAELPNVAGLVVATPTVDHAATIRDVLDRGVPIFCEKPLTNSVDDARALLRSAGDRIFVMDKWRYHPGVVALAELARREELGPVQGLRTWRLGWGNPHRDVDCVWMLLPHDLSIGMEILGRLPTVASAAGQHNAEGQFIGLTTVLSDRMWHVSELGVRSPVRQRRVELHCRDGVACLPSPDSPCLEIVHHPSDWFQPGEPRIERRAIGDDQPLLAELRGFVAYLQGGPPPKSSAAEGVQVVETIDRIRRMASAGRARRAPAAA